MAKSDGASNALKVVRIFQILTLIACWAILAALVDIYNRNNDVSPSGILCLFVVALLASVWAVSVLITQIRARNTAIWMAIFDIAFMAALIAGVILLSNITTTRCVAYTPQAVAYTVTSTGEKIWTTTNNVVVPVDPIWNYRTNHCDLAKAALGLGIANIILFFISAILSIVVFQQNKQEDEELAREKVYTRRGSAGHSSRSPSHRRHRHRHRDPRSGEYIIEERIV